MTAEDKELLAPPQANGDPPLSSATSYRWPDNRWTEPMIDWLKKMWNDNKLSARQIGKKMGFSRNAILGKANRLQLGSHKQNNGAKPAKPKPQRVERFRPRPAYPAPKQTPAMGEFLGITFEQLEPQHCRYPRGNGVPFTFCGQPVDEGCSYCAAHRRLVYVPSRGSALWIERATR